MPVIKPIIELASVLDNKTDLLAKSLLKYAVGFLKEDNPKKNRALTEISNMMAGAQGVADMLGRRRLILEIEAASRSKPKNFELYFCGDKCQHFQEPTGQSLTIPNVTFTEAVNDIIRRKPELAIDFLEVQKIYNTTRGFALARSTTLFMTEQVQKAVANALDRGQTLTEASDLIQEITGATRWYADNVFRTNVSTAYAAGRMRKASDPDLADAFPAFEFNATDDDVVRDNHFAADGLTAATRDAVWEALAPPLGYFCVLPDAMIQGTFDGASRCWYSGEILEITTKTGRVLKITPNHPIATINGFVPAGQIREGQNLFAHIGHVSSFPSDEVNEKQEPARIKDIFASFRKDGLVFSRGVVAEDFYGDALFMQGNVDVVGSEGILMNRVKTQRLKNRVHDNFVFADAQIPLEVGYGSFDTFHPAVFSSFAGGPSGPALGFDFGSVMLGDRPLQKLRFGPGSQLDSVSLEPASNRPSGNTEQFRQFIDRSAGQIQLDRVVKIRNLNFSGHVYDLSSPFGFIIADNIVISNCRCALRLVSRIELARRGLIDKFGNVIATRRSPAAFADPGFGLGRPDRRVYGVA